MPGAHLEATAKFPKVEWAALSSFTARYASHTPKETELDLVVPTATLARWLSADAGEVTPGRETGVVRSSAARAYSTFALSFLKYASYAPLWNWSACHRK